jgi:hypothetical protein
MKTNVKRMRGQLHALQDSMASQVTSCFSASEVEDLRIIVRLTVEFREKLKKDGINNYVGESVFAAVDSFATLVHAYCVLSGAEERSQLRWKSVSISSLKREFLKLYPTFIAEETFEKQCRILIDLFKLQIVLAGMAYDCRDD